MTITQLLDNARSLRNGMADGGLIREVLQPHGNEIVEQQRIQLLEGKGSDGEDLHPFYTEDIKPSGYFRSRESAQRYQDWKRTLSYPANVHRNPNAPNLYINGRFYSEMDIRFDTDSMAIMPKTGYAATIMGKYGIQRFGLSALKWKVMFEEKGVKDEIQDKMKEMLYGN